MLIFLDSNILCSNYFLNGPSFEVMRKVGTIVICEIVYDEVCNKYHEMLIENNKKMQKCFEKFQKEFIDIFDTAYDEKLKPIKINAFSS